jgi:hypothetical protein
VWINRKGAGYDVIYLACVTFNPSSDGYYARPTNFDKLLLMRSSQVTSGKSDGTSAVAFPNFELFN